MRPTTCAPARPASELSGHAPSDHRRGHGLIGNHSAPSEGHSSSRGCGPRVARLRFGSSVLELKLKPTARQASMRARGEVLSFEASASLPGSPGAVTGTFGYRDVPARLS
jgi:hypothetical protein